MIGVLDNNFLYFLVAVRYRVVGVLFHFLIQQLEHADFIRVDIREVIVADEVLE